MLESFHVVQHEHLSRAFGQPANRPFEIKTQVRVSRPRGDQVEHLIVAAVPRALDRELGTTPSITLTANRYNHVPNADSPRNVPSFSHARTNTS